MIDETLGAQVERYSKKAPAGPKRRDERFGDLQLAVNELAKAINPDAKEWKVDYELDARLATRIKSFTFSSENRISVTTSLGRLSYPGWDRCFHEILGEIAEIELQRRTRR